MGTKKGLCPYCQTKRIDHRIFPVNPEASTCFCPACMKEMEPKQAIDNYNNFVQSMLSKADNTLFVACDPSLAYQQYADVLEYEPNEAHALIGRILCLIYMGKTRKSYLKEAYILLDNTSYKGCDINTFVAFLKKINVALDEYDVALVKKLTFREHFYDIECLRLYWYHLCDIIKMKELIVSIFKSLKKMYAAFRNDKFLEELERSVEDKKAILALESFTTDGSGYKFDHISGDKVLVNKTTEGNSNRFIRFRLSTLDPNEKGKRLIKDQIFKDYTAIIKLRKIATFFSLLLFLCTGGAVVGAILFKANPTLLYMFIAFAALLFVVGSLVLAISLYWRFVLKKRELRIN